VPFKWPSLFCKQGRDTLINQAIFVCGILHVRVCVCGILRLGVCNTVCVCWCLYNGMRRSRAAFPLWCLEKQNQSGHSDMLVDCKNFSRGFEKQTKQKDCMNRIRAVKSILDHVPTNVPSKLRACAIAHCSHILSAQENLCSA